jgi:hypothetical protein
MKELTNEFARLLAANEARAEAREQALEARIQRQIDNLRMLSLPSCVVHVRSRAARILLTFTESPTALTQSKPSYLDNIVDERSGAVHANGAALDADVNLCLRMFESYALEPAINV